VVLNRVLAAALSGVAAIGIHVQWTAANHSLLITGLSLPVVMAGLWHWLVQFLYTHGWFKATSSSDQLLQLLKTFIENQPTNNPVAAGK
jgi:hypothetical protein